MDANIIINLIKNEKVKTDYILSLQRIINNKIVFKSELSILISAVPYFMNMIKNKHSEFVGLVGKKFKAHVKINSITYLSDKECPVYVCNMSDNKDNIMVWFSKIKPFFKNHQIVDIVGLVKKHKIYKNTKQTIIDKLQEANNEC